MKQGIHPEYFETKVRCACGAEVETRTTLCHPFFTGKQKLLDTAGRIEKFKRKYAKTKPQESASPQ